MMNENIYKYINDLSEEYRELLLKNLLEDADSPEDITVSRLLALDEKIKQPLRNSGREYARYLRLEILGILYSLLGITILFISLFESRFNESFLGYQAKFIDIVSVALTLTGVYIIIFIRLLRKVKSYRKRRLSGLHEDVSDFLIIDRYKELEFIVQELLPNSVMQTLKKSIKLLLENEWITSSEYQSLNEFLKMRNMAVHYHSVDSKMHYYEKLTIIYQVDKVIKRLKNTNKEKQ